MATIVHSNGNISPIKLNVFCQSTEPYKKDGIWIQTPHDAIPLEYKVKKYFAQFGNFLGKTGYKSVVFNDDNIESTYTNYVDQFFWRPFVGTNSVLFVGVENYWKSGGNSNPETKKQRASITTFDKQKHSMSKTRVLNAGYEGSGASYSVEAGTNAFEVNGYFYFYAHAETFRDSSSSGTIRTDWDAVAYKYDKTGLVETSKSTTDKFPCDYFAIGSIRGEVYAITYNSYRTKYPQTLTNASLYKVVLNGFVPLFTYHGTVPTIYTSQRTITMYGDSFYFATNNSLIKYNVATKESETYNYPSSYTGVPSVTIVGSQIFITNMSLSTKKTYLFDLETKLFKQIEHNDTHIYTDNCLMCESNNKMMIFPAKYVRDQDRNERDEADMDVTAFDITKDTLKNGTVAIEDNPIYDAKFYESTDGELYLRGLFGNVWLYENDDYQEYPTYIGNGTSWRKVKN